MKRSTSAGFTLIELMITVAIIAILASVALPAYRDSVLKGRRAQARTALLELAQAQERFFTQNNTYTAVSQASPVNGMKTFAGDSATNPPYNLSVSATTNCPGTTSLRECAVLVATPTSSDPKAGNLTLTTTGLKGCTGSTPSVCWP